MPRIGIIAGSGFYDIEGLKTRESRKIMTPYGEPSDAYRIFSFSDIEFAFLPRHGTPHHITPHKINYRANLWGFREIGVEQIVSVNAVGGIDNQLKPGDIVVPDQILDKTSGRQDTFYDKDDVVHIDFTQPFCSDLRKAITNAAADSSIRVRSSGTYICVNGPRLETKAEIHYFRTIGADIVGMTIMPEASLARELELCFAGIAVVTNYAAGIADTRLTTTEVVTTMRHSMTQIRNLIMGTLNVMPGVRGCHCPHTLKEARI